MATLQERLAHAKANPRYRTSDAEQLLADLLTEKQTLTARHQTESAASINFALSDLDRDAAAAEADRVARALKGIEVEIGEIRDLIARKQSSESAAALRKAREAALEERDALAERIPALYAEAASKLIDLAAKIIASDEHLRAVGLGTEMSAEAIARGCNGMFSIRGMPVMRLTQIRLPQLAEYADLWPAPDASAAIMMAGAVQQLEGRSRPLTAVNGGGKGDQLRPREPRTSVPGMTEEKTDALH